MSTTEEDAFFANLRILSGREFIAGWVSGITSTLVGHPLETIKVRQQTAATTTASRSGGGGVASPPPQPQPQPQPHFAAMLKNEGFKCFFRGLSYPVYATGVLNSLYFGSYANSLRFLENRRGECHRRSCCDGDGVPAYSGWHLDCFYAGLVGGTIATLVNTPVELAKTILQARAVKFRSKDTLTPTRCLTNLFRSRGLRGCYHGGLILTIRDVPAFGLYAVCYEHILCMQKNRFETDSSSPLITSIYEGVAGGFAGVITWFLAVPLDVIKSRFMYDGINGEKNRKYSGMIDCAMKTYGENGIKTFYKGLGIILLRAFPVNFICFITYERTLRLTNKYF